VKPMEPTEPVGSDGSGKPVKLSVLDVAPVGTGYSATEALRTSTDLAKLAEQWGYHRFWVAEHHNMPGIASSSPPVLLAHLAAHTSTLRLGSGGVMLPNHAPLVVAEEFPQALGELIGFVTGSWAEDHPYRRMHAVPGPASGIEAGGEFASAEAPVWLLGSSGYSAQLAGMLGLPFAFAHHFSGRNTVPALELYRESFQPSESLKEPYSMIAAGVIAADTRAQAKRLALSQALTMLRLRSGNPGRMPSPEEAEAYPWTPAEREFAQTYQSEHIVGDLDEVRAGMHALRERTRVDELMVISNVYGHDARIRSYELIAQAWGLIPD
jgi:alkanesulfonate monooxygenase SsuD/methylene tetrahydromethanopterin reductase-like flavin-dependent oxidoreductase (luciferase family)